ncbi:MAG: VanZ family protein [Clostridia bacterium]|nr:VanZ family protein [Clostridia bacterium]
MTRRNRKINKSLLFSLIVIYLIILLWVIVFKCNYNEALHVQENLQKPLIDRIEKIPFRKCIDAYKTGYMSAIEIIALIFNMICLIPFGCLMRFYTDKKWSLFVAGVVFSTGVEIFQLFSGWGGLEYADIIINTLGVVVGGYIYDLIRPNMNHKRINKLLRRVVICTFPIAVFVIINSNIHFPE